VVEELVEDEVTGLLINDRNDSLIEAVRRLQGQPELWQRLSTTARAKIERSYSQSVCTEKWLTLLHQLHQQSSDKRSIHSPKNLRLPPTRPSFWKEDCRQLAMLARTANRRLTYPLRSMKKAVKKMMF
jgi:hypothetical protein